MENENETLNYEDKALTYFSLLWGIMYLAIGSLQVLKGAELLPDGFISASLLPRRLQEDWYSQS
ncbi:MAG: hypothetical protein NHB15_10025 [Methanosarcina barkeri]|nr:hypothetical protein [Methanosarcina sp. ERenArc_MAG2]